MRYRAPVVIALLLALSAGCQREAEDYISVDGKIFIFNIRLARAYYALTLNRKEATPDGAVVIAEFENPAGGEALVSRQKVFPNMKRIDLQSPDVECVVADRPYRISIRLEDQSGKILQTIDTTLSSTIDQSVMPEKPLVTGAAYDRNPEAFAADGKVKLRQPCKAAS